jgi:hypothetical protein
MNKEPPNITIIAAIIGATAIIIAAMISLVAPFVENWATNYRPPSTATVNFPISSPQIIVVTATFLPQETSFPISTQISPQVFDKCLGQCWEYDDINRTMTWTRTADGDEDIWQPSGPALEKIRSGYIAIITTAIPGEIFACVLNINGQPVKNSCDDVLYQIPAGTYQITSPNNDVGGFRWCPKIGQGWRVNGGECK